MTVPPAPLGGHASALAVFAHPDDESFGLGAVLDALRRGGTATSALCFTHGEASTLGATVDLHDVRAAELGEAAAALGLGEVELLAYHDGQLDQVDPAALALHVVEAARRVSADLLVVFDDGGVTGHPDHNQATRAALLAADRLDVPVLAWTVRAGVAAALDAEFGTTFVGRSDDDVDVDLPVDRSRQLAAIACHQTQATDNPVLWRRLELTGPTEPLRWLRQAAAVTADRGATA